MFVNKASTSKLAILRSLFCVKISSKIVKESLTVNSLCVISDRMENKNLASLYVGVPIAERIGMNGSNPIIKGLCISADP